MTISKYTLPAYLSRLLILVIDIGIICIAYILATLIRFNYDIRSTISYIKASFLIYIAVRLIFFYFFKTYSVIVRFAGAADLKKIIPAVFIPTLLMMLFILVLRPLRAEYPAFWGYHGFLLSHSVLIIDFFLVITMMSGFRLIMPFLFKVFFRDKKMKQNVVVFGAGEMGSQIANLINTDNNSQYAVAAILDDNPDVHMKFLNGVPVYNPNLLNKITSKYDIEKAIIGVKELPAERKSEFINSCLKENVQVLNVALKMGRSISKNFSERNLKQIQIEDLLNRASINLENDLVGKEVNDQVILITGAAGSIGSELVRQVLNYKPKKLILIDQSESPLVDLGIEIRENFSYDDYKTIIADVSDIVRISKLFDQYRPNIVMHAAAYKHVPIMESFPREAINVNVNGTRVVANCSHNFKVDKFVLVSTDKAVNPTNVMGASKRIAELYIQSLNKESTTKFITTRFGNVLGSNGSVVPRFRKQIEAGGPVTITHPEITRYFMTIPEAARLILEAGTIGEGGEIYLFDMGDPIKIKDLAFNMIKLSGLQPNIDIPIEYTGLRPGEKLTEELLATEENSVKTHHNKILKALVRDFDFKSIDKDIHDLIGAMDVKNEVELVEMIKSLVPEYRSTNSAYLKVTANII